MRKITLLFSAGLLWPAWASALADPLSQGLETVEPQLPLKFHRDERSLGRDNLYQTVAVLSSEAMEGRAPRSKGSRLAREYIIGKMKAYGLLPGGEEEGFVQAVHKKVLGYKIGSNVVGYVPGRKNPDECVYVDAHYDHWGKAGGKIQPGANDNASGVALMLETARQLAQEPPDRTVVFLASENEEGALLPMMGGLKGANYHTRHPVCAADRIKGAVILDTVGGAFVPGMKSQLILIGSESSQATYDLAKGLAESPDQAFPVRQLGVYAIEPLGTWVPRADYGAYRKIGVPFIFATSGLPAEYHSEADTIEKIDFDFMEKTETNILELVSRMSSESFQAAPASNQDQVIDWDRELASAGEIVDSILNLAAPSPEKDPFIRKLRTGRGRLQALSGSAGNDKEAVKKAVRKTVITIMKMNGSLKVWEHVYRTHGVPRDE